MMKWQCSIVEKVFGRTLANSHNGFIVTYDINCNLLEDSAVTRR